METKKVYSLHIGGSAYGNGGRFKYFNNAADRDKEFSNTHKMDCPDRGEFDAVVINGELYYPTSKITLET